MPVAAGNDGEVDIELVVGFGEEIAVGAREDLPSVPSEVVLLARDVLIDLGTGVASAFVYDAFKSWVDPNNGKRITKLGDMELSNSEVSVDEFRTLLKALQKVKEESDIRAKILEAGIKITVVEWPRNSDAKKGRS